MFKKEISPSAKTKVKSSAQRAIRAKVTEMYPLLAPIIDEVVPKKEQLDLVKLPDRISLYVLNGTPLFFQHMDDPLLPHLALVHRYPSCFPRVRVDRGAVRFVLSGANLMVPGLTSKGGRLPGEGEEGGGEVERYGGGESGWREAEKGEVMVVEAEGKEEACFVGVLKMGTAEMKREKKGLAFEAGHYLGDGLWRLKLD